ncbi:hypothetical protein E2320_014806 [Naja naja]|nr:hypothetical protein E2320_014806 [Naja naja]
MQISTTAGEIKRKSPDDISFLSRKGSLIGQHGSQYDQDNYAYGYGSHIFFHLKVQCVTFTIIQDHDLRLKMGVKVKYLSNEGYQFSYFTRGEPGSRPSVLMLHGFSLNKDMWLNTIEVFPKDLHLVCLDLPGHGGTTRLLGESYTAVAQAKRIHQFVQCAGLNHKPFHLVGMSMGGMVAGLRELIFSKGSVENAVIPVTEEQLENFIKLCLYHPIFLKIQVFWTSPAVTQVQPP